MSDDDDFSCDEDQEETGNLSQSSSVTPLQQKQEKISYNSFKLLKKLPSSYGRSNSFKRTAVAKNHTHQQQDGDDVMSDDSCGTRNETLSGSHDQEATLIDENMSQLFDDHEDTNSDIQEKTKGSVIISKSIKPNLGKIITCVFHFILSDVLESQAVKANPFKVSSLLICLVTNKKK